MAINRVILLLMLVVSAFVSTADAEERTGKNSPVPSEECQNEYDAMYFFNDVGPHDYMKEINAPKEVEAPKASRKSFRILFEIFLYAVFVLLVTAIAVVIMRNIPSFRGLFAKKKKRPQGAQQHEEASFDSEPIFGHDYESEVRQALASGDVRRAIRLAYLTTLADLHEKRIIICAESKTPMEYSREVESRSSEIVPVFRDLTRIFLVASYADVTPVPDDFYFADAKRRELSERAVTIDVPDKKNVQGADNGAGATSSVVKLIMGFVLALSLLTSCTSEDRGMWVFSSLYDPLGQSRFNKLLDVQYSNYYAVFDTNKVDILNGRRYDDLLLFGVASDVDSASYNLTISENVLAERLKNRAHTLIAAERLFVTSSNSKVLYGGSVIEGDYYRQVRLVDDVNDDGIIEMSVLHSETTGNEWMFPKVMSGCYIDKTRLDKLWQQLRKDIGIQIGLQTLFSIDGKPVAWRLRAVNGGTLVITSLPLMMTDYGLLFNDGRWGEIVFKMLREVQFSDDVAHAIEFGKGCDSQFSAPWYSYPSLSRSGSHNPELERSMDRPKEKMTLEDWFIIGIVLVLVLLLYRRQRAVAIIDPPQNKTVDFIRHAAVLYEAQGDYQNILTKRVATFYAFLSERLHVDATSADDTVVAVISVASGESMSEVSGLLTTLNSVVKNKGFEISAGTAMSIIDRMENVENGLMAVKKEMGKRK